MKILHTADIHLGVKYTRLPKDAQNLLKDEFVFNVRNFFDLAKKGNYDIILICGDLFHSKSVSNKIVKSFFDAVRDYSSPVVYITGNHDESFSMPSITPENFIFLNKSNPVFCYGDCDFYSEFDANMQLNTQHNNILLLHGNLENTRDSDYFDISKFLNKGFDYIALGHVHQFKIYEKGKDTFAYPGCLFSNGFDEGGERGFISLNIDDHLIKSLKFEPFSSRKFLVCDSDISNLETNRQIIDKVEKDLQNLQAGYQDLIKLVLKGALSEDNEKSLPFIQSKFENYFYFEIEDKTTLKIDIEMIKKEKLSFKYEFISLIEESQLDEDSKRIVREIGLEALKGEDINL